MSTGRLISAVCSWLCSLWPGSITTTAPGTTGVTAVVVVLVDVARPGPAVGPGSGGGASVVDATPPLATAVATASPVDATAAGRGEELPQPPASRSPSSAAPAARRQRTSGK